MNANIAINTKNRTGLNCLAISSRIQSEVFLAGKIGVPEKPLFLLVTILGRPCPIRCSENAPQNSSGHRSQRSPSLIPPHSTSRPQNNLPVGVSVRRELMRFLDFRERQHRRHAHLQFPALDQSIRTAVWGTIAFITIFTAAEAMGLTISSKEVKQSQKSGSLVGSVNCSKS
jgi:hypothetical protein